MLTYRDDLNQKDGVPAANFYTAFDHINIGFCITEPVRSFDGSVKDVIFRYQNRLFDSHTGIKNALGKTMGELLPGFRRNWISTYEKAVLTKESVQQECYVPDLDRWYKTSFLRPEDSTRTLVPVLFEDVTERKRREAAEKEKIQADADHEESVEHYRNLFENMDEGYCMIQMLYDEGGKATDWRFLRVNPAFERHNGLSEATGKTIRELAPAIEQKWVDIYNNVAETGQSIRFEEDSEALGRVFDLYAFRIGKPQERKVAVLFTDITERKASERVLLEREKQLKQLIRQRDEFIGIASHELKTPITSIKGYAGIIRDWLATSADSEKQYIASRLTVQIDKLIALVNHLLDTTMISEGQLTLNLREIDFNKLLVEMIEEVRQTTHHKLMLDTEQFRPLVADGERIGQVIVNLLTNAIKYSPDADTVLITAKNTGNGISVSIKDKGHGIAVEDQKRIFERFFRVRSNNMDSYPGMGLGLYISAQLIYQHGGTISVDSKLHEGATFSFTLPYPAHQ